MGVQRPQLLSASLHNRLRGRAAGHVFLAPLSLTVLLHQAVQVRAVFSVQCYSLTRPAARQIQVGTCSGDPQYREGAHIVPGAPGQMYASAVDATLACSLNNEYKDDYCKA
ncbi:hypothetical protein AURDEDRAFT_117976 [Auricularia subglabra TFB-10046 SS5]|uniref:Uncharacterized protein n=1 Tax=Auricularia subglabra (strain TFB-10046 / SS5) TaxID=717982 RepID=J0WLR6_AURST|nr:hypothetical protein AURDEDRAFT_117976 [Auricularia subglabra TFB-10046 SS5]